MTAKNSPNCNKSPNLVTLTLTRSGLFGERLYVPSHPQLMDELKGTICLVKVLAKEQSLVNRCFPQFGSNL